MSSLPFQKHMLYTKKSTLYNDYKRQFISKSTSCKDFYHISPSNSINISKEKTIADQYKDKGKFSKCLSSSHRSISFNQTNSSVNTITHDIISSPLLPKEFKKKLSTILLDTLSNIHVDYDRYKHTKTKQQNSKIKLQKEEIMKILNNSNSKFHHKLKLAKPTNSQKSIISNKKSESNKSFYDKSFRKTIGHNHSIIFQQYNSNRSNHNLNHFQSESRKDLTLENSKIKTSKRIKGNKSIDIRFLTISKSPKLSTIEHHTHNPPYGIMAYQSKTKNSLVKTSFHKEIKTSASKTSIVKQIEFKVPIKELMVNDCFTFRKVDLNSNNTSSSNKNNNNTHRSTSENGSYHNSKEIDQLSLDNNNNITNNNNKNTAQKNRLYNSYHKQSYLL